MFASAQDTPDECEAAPGAIEIITEFLAEPVTPLQMLRYIYEAAQEALIACGDYSYSSEADGARPVLGPLTFPEGIYRATVTTEKLIGIKIFELDGTCGTQANVSGYLFLVREGEARDGAQAVFTSSGCELLLEFASAEDPWTLTFEKLR